MLIILQGYTKELNDITICTPTRYSYKDLEVEQAILRALNQLKDQARYALSQNAIPFWLSLSNSPLVARTSKRIYESLEL